MKETALKSIKAKKRKQNVRELVTDIKLKNKERKQLKPGCFNIYEVDWITGWRL